MPLGTLPDECAPSGIRAQCTKTASRSTTRFRENGLVDLVNALDLTCREAERALLGVARVGG